MEKGRDNFPRRIEQSVRDLLRARGEEGSFWHYAAVIGMGGWLFALPVVAGAYLGKFLDGKVASGISWTVTCIIIGIAAGMYNLWYFLFRKGGK
jgi:ATP synthase protein I